MHRALYLVEPAARPRWPIAGHVLFPRALTKETDLAVQQLIQDGLISEFEPTVSRAVVTAITIDVLHVDNALYPEVARFKDLFRPNREGYVPCVAYAMQRRYPNLTIIDGRLRDITADQVAAHYGLKPAS